MKKKQIEDTFDGIKLTDTEYVSAAPSRGGVQQRHRYGKNQGSGRVNARVAYGGNHYNPAQKLSEAFKEALDRAMSFQPVTELDPKTFVAPPLDQWEHRRFLAAKAARKYYNWQGMKTKARWLRQGRPLNMWQCAVILNEARRIVEWIEKNPKPE